MTTTRNSAGTNTILPGADAFYVLSVKQAVPAKIDSKKMAEVKTELQNMSVSGIQEDYNQFLTREYPIKINEKVYRRFFGK